MSASDSWKLLVFRDGKTVRNSSGLLQALHRQIKHVLSLHDFTSLSAQEELIDALLRAGELECGLSDASFPVETLGELTDRLAFALISRQRAHLPSSVLDALSSCALPERIAISPPEGFCYYALHPLDYADLLEDSEVNAPAGAVVGIRSIGTTLSAVVSAWFNLRGVHAERITVRPSGHPFERSVTFEGKQREWIVQRIQHGTHFFVVDEGPGLSGSSFLAVAEALEQAGVPSGLITLLPSSIPNLDNLLAPNAAARWNRFRTLALSPTRRIPEEAAHDISGGEWRKRAFTSESQWPAVWPWTERRKYLSEDGKRLFRFDGHGHYGKTARQRSELLADHGWGPEVKSAGNGFTEFPWLTGTRPGTANRETVIQLARYCAFRAKHFSQTGGSQASLEEMARINLERALGVSIPISLPVERPVIADARMMPYEWIRCADGRMMKLDASSHGDDHFYPGLTDIAWDIAGVITEWGLGDDSLDFFVSEYQRFSGDKIGTRLSGYLIAYCVFRLALAMSAGSSVGDADEQLRFQRAIEKYAQLLKTRKTSFRLQSFPGEKIAGLAAGF